MAQLQSSCILGTLSLSASSANAQDSIIIGGSNNNAEFNNQCNLIAIGTNTSLSGSGGLDPSTLTVTQQGSGFGVSYSYYQISACGCTKPTVTTGGGGGSGATFSAFVQRVYYPGTPQIGEINGISLCNPGSGYTSRVTGTVCDPTRTTETCEIFTIDPFQNNNSINIGHNAGCRAQGPNNIRIGTCAGLGNPGNSTNYHSNNILIGCETAVSGAFGENVIIGHSSGKGKHCCTTPSFSNCFCCNIIVGHNSFSCTTTRGLSNVVIGNCIAISSSCGASHTTIGVRNHCCSCRFGNFGVTLGAYNYIMKGTCKIEGNCNLAIGQYNFCCQSSGINNIGIGCAAIGHGLLNGANYNVSVGRIGLCSLTTGDNNVSVGAQSGCKITTGGQNITIGYFAGNNQCTGARSIYIGCGAGCGTSNQNDSIFIGNKVASYGASTNGGHIAIGIEALRNMCAGYFNTAIGYFALYNASCTSSACALDGGCNIAIGYLAGGCVKGASNNNLYIGQRSGPSTATNQTYKFYLGNGTDNHLMCGCLADGSRALCVNGTFSKTTGTFAISHPNPSKTQDCELLHSFVESPTAGDNLYRFEVEVENGTATIDLPNYYKYLNENDQVWVNAKNHFGRAYGVVNQEQTTLTVFADTEDGKYNVLLIGTRKDKDAVEAWKGTERLKEN